MLWFATLASVATSLAEILGGAIALEMLFDVPVKIGAVLVTVLSLSCFLPILSEDRKWIIGFVSIIGLSFFMSFFLSMLTGLLQDLMVRPSIRKDQCFY